MELPTELYRWAWWSWLAFFVLLETIAVIDPGQGDTLTENVRPVLHAHPLTWLVAAGFILWLAVHFLAPGIEAWIARLNAPWRW
jgi:hypothetical protein